MLHAKQRCENNPARQQPRPLPRVDNRQNEDTIHGAIVLKVYVVDNQESRGEKDGQSNHI